MCYPRLINECGKSTSSASYSAPKRLALRRHPEPSPETANREPSAVLSLEPMACAFSYLP